MIDYVRFTFAFMFQIEEDIIQDEMGFSTGQIGEDSGQVRAMQSTQRKSVVSKKLQVCDAKLKISPFIDHHFFAERD